MCEHFVARSETPFRIDELWDFTERLERFGIAAFGWGAAWLTGAGSIETHRDIGSFRDDPRKEAVGRAETSSLLVHLRRPSKLSTIGLPDTQPFLDPAGRFAFSHNGDLTGYKPWRERFRAEGRIAGKADSEPGARWLEDQWREGEPASHLLGALHDAFGGNANLAVLDRHGNGHLYAGNRDNPCFSFRLGRIAVVSTGLHSFDRSLFKFTCPGATDRKLIPLHRTASLEG
jgi:hypothetical protein